MVALGNVAVETIHDWSPAPGTVVTWAPTAKSAAAMAAAPVSDVPASAMQAQHLRGYLNHAARGLRMSRLCIAAWDMPGQADLRAMTFVVNSHLRRHDVYRSWFDVSDPEAIVRHTVDKPKAIAFEATEHGELSAKQWRDFVLSTPSPLHWDCFRFAITQRDDHFTFTVVIDHLHIDAMFMGAIFVEVFTMYAALASGAPPIALPPALGYTDFCVRQQHQLAELTVESPQVQRWIAFARENGGSMPDFPLPLGDTPPGCGGELRTVRLMDRAQMDDFETACVTAGARFSGGVFASVALTEFEVSGQLRYHAITPNDTRTGPEEYFTLGWFTGMVPITVEVSPDSFADTVRSAQKSFDTSTDLAEVAYDRVLELAPAELGLHRAPDCRPMVSYLDAGLPPLSAAANSQLDGLNAQVYGDGDFPAQLCMWINRLESESSLTVFFPATDTARAAVDRYVETLKSVFRRISAGQTTFEQAAEPTPRMMT